MPQSPQEKTAPVPPNVIGMTTLYLVTIAAVLLFTDSAIQFFRAVGGQAAEAFYQENLWIEGILGYLPIYVLMLFYLKSTFNPLRTYGYTWKSDYLWWAVYLGAGSGIIIFLVDFMQGIARWSVQPLAQSSVLGYLISWVILAPLFEETLFRGVIQRYYQQHFKKTVTQFNIHIAVFLGLFFELLFHAASAVYYGATQVGAAEALIAAIPQLIYVAVFGFISGWFYQRTGSLVAPVVIHGLGNLTELILIWTVVH